MGHVRHCRNCQLVMAVVQAGARKKLEGAWRAKSRMAKSTSAVNKNWYRMAGRTWT